MFSKIYIMGFFKKIGHKFKKARRIGEKVAHGVAIGLRKGGKAIQKGAQIAGKLQPFLETAGKVYKPLAVAGKALGAGVAIATKAGQLTADVGRSGSQFLKDKDASSFLERSKAQRSLGEEIFKK